MIPITELRLGNLLTGVYDEENELSEIVEVVCLDRTGGEITEYQIWADGTKEHYDTFEPIELTEERLKKAGFKKMPGNTFQNINLPYWCKDSVLLFFNTGQEEYSFKIGYGESVEGKYFAATFRWINELHILQNIFYDFTSKELTIKL